MTKLDLSYIGPLLKEARISAGLTQEKLAEKIGITPRFLMGIENEGRTLSLDTFLLITRALGLPGDIVIYPEQNYSDKESSHMLHMFQSLNQRDKKIILSMMQEMLQSR